jgi:hypothetical protein
MSSRIPISFVAEYEGESDCQIGIILLTEINITRSIGQLALDYF